MMNDSEEEEEQTALVCDNGNYFTQSSKFAIIDQIFNNNFDV